MNERAPRVDQTLMRKFSTVFKDAELPLKWWPEFFVTANLLRNRSPATGLINKDRQPITPFEASIGHQYNYGRLRDIEHSGEVLVIKPIIGWKKFQDRTVPMRHVVYNGEHIYQMIDSDGKVHRCSSINWLDNTRSASSTDDGKVDADQNKSRRLCSFDTSASSHSSNTFTCRDLDDSTAINDFPNSLGIQDEVEINGLVLADQSQVIDATEGEQRSEESEEPDTHTLPTDDDMNQPRTISAPDISLLRLDSSHT